MIGMLKGVRQPCLAGSGFLAWTATVHTASASLVDQMLQYVRGDLKVTWRIYGTVILQLHYLVNA